MNLNRYFDFKKLEKLSPKNIKRDFNELKNNIYKKDIVILATLPIILTTLMFLQPNIRNSLKLNIYNPSWWQFLTSSFIHENFSYYEGNVSLLLILLFLQIIIISKMKEQKRYFYISTFIILSFPLISSFIQVLYYPIALPTVKTSSGTSGIVAAFIGFIPVFLIEYLSKSIRKNLADYRFFSIILLYVVSTFIIIYYPYHKNLLLALGFPTLMLVFTYSYKNNIIEICKSIFNESNNNVIFYFLLVFLLLIFLIAPLLLFPVNFVQESGLVDFGTHYLGLIYGFVISIISFKTFTIKKMFEKINNKFHLYVSLSRW